MPVRRVAVPHHDSAQHQSDSMFVSAERRDAGSKR
jgi:hypothetical protein